MTLKKTIISVSVHDENDNPVFGESVTIVSIKDEAGGPFIKVKQCNDYSELGSVTFNDVEELKMVCDVAEELLKQFTNE